MYLLLKWFFIATLSDSLLGVAADLPDCDVCNLETYECSLDSMTSGFNPPGQGAGPLCGDCDEDGDCFCSCENQFERDPHCAELEAKYPECDDDYEGDMSCDPSQEDIDYYMAHCDEEANDCLSSCWECQDNRDTCLFEYDGNQDQDFDTFDCDIACTGSPDTSMCMSHSDCSGDTPFCYEGQCDSCQECHFCHDGIDGTCGSCGDGFPTQEDGPCEAHDGVDEWTLNESAVGFGRLSRSFEFPWHEESAVGNNQPLTEEVTGIWSHSNVWIQGFAVIGFFALLKSMHSVCAQKSGDTLYQDVSQEA